MLLESAFWRRTKIYLKKSKNEKSDDACRKYSYPRTSSVDTVSSKVIAYVFLYETGESFGKVHASYIFSPKRQIHLLLEASKMEKGFKWKCKRPYNSGGI